MDASADGWVADMAAASGRAGSRFIGRQAELDELRGGLRDAIQGSGRLFLISGDPGIGKTRLADEIAWQAQQDSVRVLWGRAWEGGGAPAFWPWMQVLRRYLREPSPRAAVPAAEMARLLPDMFPRALAAAHPTLDPEQARFQMFDAVSTLLHDGAASQPLLIILDDLHGADADSLLLLRFLARAVRTIGLLLVGTYREVEAAQSEGVTGLIDDLLRESTHLPLRGLSEAEVGALVTQALAGQRDAATTVASPPLVAAVHHATEGNPFFVDEIIRLWLAEGHVPEFSVSDPGALSIPTQVRETIRRRLRLLSAATGQALATAAVIAKEFDVRILERLLQPEDSTTVAERLAEAARASVLREVAAHPRRYAFTHALLRDTLYHDLPAPQRVALHRRVGRIMTELYHRDLDAHVADIAYHFCAGAADGDAEDAAAYSSRAARQAAALGAYDDAVRHAFQAVRALERCDEDAAAPGTRDRQRCELLLALGDALNAAGDRDRARETFQRVADLARQLETPDAFAQAALGFGGSTLMVEPANTTNDSAVFARDDTLGRLLEEALERLGAVAGGAAAHPLRPRLLSRLALERYFADPLPERLAITDEAVALARRLGDPVTLARVLSDATLAIWGPDTVLQRRVMTEEMVHLAAQIGEPTLELLARAWLIGTLFELGDGHTMDPQLAHFRRLVEECRQPAHWWGLKSHLAMRALLTGHFDEAEGLARDAVKAAGPTHPVARITHGIQIGMLRRERGQLDKLAASEPILRAAADILPMPNMRITLALTYAALQRQDDARREFDRIAAQGFANIWRDNNWMHSLSEAAEVCCYLRDTHCAATLYELLLPCAQYNSVSVFVAVSWGAVARSLGVLATLLSDWAAAEAHFKVALQHNRALGAEPWIARTQHDYAVMLLGRNRRRDAAQARGLLADAIRTARALGMKPLEEAVSRLVSPAVSSAPHPQRSTPRDRRADAARTVPETRASSVFRREADFWTIAYGGRVVRIKDSRGLQYLAHLLRHPGEQFHALDLLLQLQTSPAEGQTSGDSVTGRAPRPPMPNQGLPVLDARARAEYRQRLDELVDEIEEAERLNDIGRSARAREEIECLRDQLSAATGLGGRERTVGAHAERARMAVTKRIKDAVRRLHAAHASLGRHLAATIHTGYFCTYLPDREFPVEWVF
jgi:tetratricopeptide (TPR) repeat protein